MRVSKILCATDFSDGAEAAIRCAAFLARASNAELVIVHAFHVPAYDLVGEVVLPSNLMRSVLESANVNLNDAVAVARDAGARQAVGRLLTGFPRTEIVAMVEREEFDLCVIGTHGRTGLSRVLLGSIAEKIVRHASCSVLVVRPGYEPAPFRHVLVPTDFTDSARNALDFAGELVQPDGVLTLLHALEFPVAYSGEISIDEFVRELDARTITALAAEVAHISKHTTANVTKLDLVGSPGGQVLTALDRDPSIDLVVMGSHGRTGLSRAVLGSVAEKVVRHAHCPVLVARHLR